MQLKPDFIRGFGNAILCSISTALIVAVNKITFIFNIEDIFNINIANIDVHSFLLSLP